MLTLSYIGDQVTLDVRDDGTGFDPAAVAAAEPGPGGGFGLTAMRERVEGLAGTLAIESEPGAGTTISVSLPLLAAGPGAAEAAAGVLAAAAPAAGAAAVAAADSAEPDTPGPPPAPPAWPSMSSAPRAAGGNR